MKKIPLLCATTIVSLMLSGCLPQPFVWWSPDGKTAAIRTTAGLRLSDANGSLSAVILPGEIQSAAWSPDGLTLVVSRSLKSTNWTEIEAGIPPAEAAATAQLARAIPGLLKAGLEATGGSLEEVVEKFLQPLDVNPDKLLPAVYCALSSQRAAIEAAIAGATNKAALTAELDSALNDGIPVHEICVLTIRQGLPAGPPRTLVRSLFPLTDPVVSPRYPVVAFRCGEGGLKAMRLDGAAAIEVLNDGAKCAAWSPDGRSLVVVTGEMDNALGEIRSLTVLAPDGQLVSTAPQAESLAVAAFPGSDAPRVSVLPDGRLLFASLAITLPASAGNLKPTAQFYLLNPAQPDAAPEPVVVREGSLPDELSSFVVSPDGKRVAVVEGGTDAVGILDLASGKVQVVSPPHEGCKSRMLPAWKSGSELTFAALRSAGKIRPELVVWQANGSERVLSRDWPDDVVQPWVEGQAKEGAVNAR